MAEPTHPLRPDESSADYLDFYRRIGAAQLEETYYTRHGYAVARYHLLFGLLASQAEAGSHLLDVGCASGYYAVRYALRGGRVTGTDVADASLQLASRRAQQAGVTDRCRFVPGDLRSLPFEDESFDCVLLTEVLEHVREQREALAEVTRVLRPGGILVLSSPGALDGLPTRRRIALRNASTPEEAGVEVPRLGQSDTVAAAGIEHEPYFHDAFTLPSVRALVPPELEVLRLKGLLFVPPRAVSYGFLISEALRRRMPGGRKRNPPPLADQGSELVEIPEPYAEVHALMSWTRLCWRVPGLREAGVGVLLVGRRR
jgi:SAM-dependent methyltransferase